MYNKKDRTLELYMKTGAEMRLLKSLYTRTAVDVSKLLPVKEYHRLVSALDTINSVCSRVEVFPAQAGVFPPSRRR